MWHVKALITSILKKFLWDKQTSSLHSDSKEQAAWKQRSSIMSVLQSSWNNGDTVFVFTSLLHIWSEYKNRGWRWTSALLILLLTSEFQIDQSETESSDKLLSTKHLSSPSQIVGIILLSNFTIQKFL